MDGNRSSGVPSTASIFGHPIHPMLVPFPIAFLIGAFICDLAFWWTGDPFWARGAFWLLAPGLVIGALAAVVGLADFVTIRRAREYIGGWIHSLGNTIVLLLALLNVMARIEDPIDGVFPWGILLSFLTAALLGVTGWYGGELAYRYGIGFSGQDNSESGND
jgi:uncharacterized membrane protein